MKKVISVKQAFIIPFVILIIGMMSLVALIWREDYRWILNSQGTKILNAISENTSDRLKYFIEDSKLVTKSYANSLEESRSYSFQDLTRAENFTRQYILSIMEHIPQVSTIGFGNENGDYLGFRVDGESRKINLMLKDVRTDGKLKIFEGETSSSSLVASYDGYDPRVRPWYAPVKQNQKIQWSEVYVNFDEKMEATISILIPLFDAKKKFEGVVVVDIKLAGIHVFLKDQATHGGSAIYIQDQAGKVIGQSDESSIFSVTDAGPPPTGELIDTKESLNPLIKASGEYLNKKISSFKLSQENIFLREIPFTDNDGLNWKVVAVITEKDLMGDVLAHQMASLFMMMVSIMGILLMGLLVINRITKPLIKTSKLIRKIDESHFELATDEESFSLREMNELTDAFNHMAGRLKESFYNLKKSEADYKNLVENSEDMIYSMDMEGRFTSVNTSFEKNMGVLRDDIIGKTARDLNQSQEEIEKWMDYFESTKIYKTSVKTLTHIHSQDGKETAYNMTLIPTMDDKGNVVAITGTSHNISDFIEREAERIASLTYVVAGIAHEINTPLGNCLTITTYLKSEVNTLKSQLVEGIVKKSNLNEFIDTIEESNDQLIRNLEKSEQLIESFKGLAIDREMEEKMDVRLCNLIKSSFETMTLSYSGKSVALSLKCSSNLTIFCEEIKLIQVFHELFENSFIHGFESVSDGKIELEVFEEVQTGTIHLTYRDDGVGIPKDRMKDVFTPFYSTKFSKAHSGLGLNVVYNIIRGYFKGEMILNENCEKGIELKISIKK